jgi:thiol-disulfide isomerase/thioredoxin
MFWPDYSPRKKKTTRWRGIGFFLALIVSLFLAGAINGWWEIVNSRDNPQVEIVSLAAEEDVLDSVGETVVTAVTVQPTATPFPSLNVATAAPNFSLPDLNGDTNLRSLEDYEGKPVILNFWASWCVPCREEMPALQRIYEQYNPDGLVILGINQTFVDDLETARTFVQELSLTFPNVRDDEGDISGSLYRAMGLPTSVFIGQDGAIAHVQVGQLTDEQISLYSERLMAGEEIFP